MRPTSDAHDGTHYNGELCYPDGLLGELQQVLGDLADIEDQCEADQPPRPNHQHVRLEQGRLKSRR